MATDTLSACRDIERTPPHRCGFDESELCQVEAAQVTYVF